MKKKKKKNGYGCCFNRPKPTKKASVRLMYPSSKDNITSVITKHANMNKNEDELEEGENVTAREAVGCEESSAKRLLEGDDEAGFEEDQDEQEDASDELEQDVESEDPSKVSHVTLSKFVSCVCK